MHFLYSALRINLFLLSGLLLSQVTLAQAIPDNVFYIPLPEPQLQTAFKNLTTAPLTTTVISNTISVSISIVATSNNTVIYYDHWEDGYQANFTGTRQSSTQVWGDNDASNGIPPGYATDLINAGDRINLTNNVALPRSTSVIVYDGRDKIASTRFLSVTRIGVPTSPGSVLGSSVELYDTTIYDRSFQIPVGETSDGNAGSNCCLFEYTSIFVIAREDNTVVQLMPNPNSSTIVSVTLNEGESYQYTGSIVGDVLAGATVTADKPVQVDLFTGDIGAQYESRTFAMYPKALWDNCYYNPVGRTTPNADVNAFIFNPGPNSLTINARTTLGVSSFVVGPMATYRYNMPDNSGAHFYTTNESDKFFAVGVHDTDLTEQSTWDWGFSLLPEVFLSTAAVVGYGPGSSPISATSLNGSPVWVLATQATTLYVDYDGDPSTGNLTDPNGGKYDIAYSVVADQSQRIFDNTDKDQTGLRVYTLDGTKIAVAWGEDASIAGNGLPYLDLGTTVTPEKKVLVSKRALLTVDNGQTGIVDPGDEVTYQIIIENSSLRTRNVVSITDTIPTGFSYIAGSTRRNRLTVIPDQTSPNSVFPLDENGYALGDLILDQKDTLSFRVTAQRSLVAAATVTNRVSYTDSRDEVVSGQVTISINQNYPPVANRDNVTTAFNTPVTIPILDNDVDKANRPAALTNVMAPFITSNPANGAAVVNADGSITYTPNNTFAGADALIYRICDNINNALCDTALVTITILSAPPIANPETVNINFNVTTTVLVLTNDVDKTNRPAALTNVSAPIIIQQPTNGSAVVNGAGAIIYDPNDAFAGVDTLTYRICDNINPSLCDTTFVAFNIGSQAPNVSSDLATTPFNTTILVNILANDTGRAGQPASLSMVTLPQLISNPVNGTAIINANGTLTYTPNPTFAGIDTLRYQICDDVNNSLCNNDLVTITVQSAPPTANRDNATMMFNASLTIPILTNDVDKAGRPAALTNVTAPIIIRQGANGVGIVNSNGSLTYDPGNTFAGLDTLIYRICDNVDNSLCDTALVVVSILSAPPKPIRDDVITAFNTNITIQVLANDSDKANRPAALTNVTAPTIVDPTNNGLATVNSDGTITYDPFNTFAGRDTLIYSICDNITPVLCCAVRRLLRFSFSRLRQPPTGIT